MRVLLVDDEKELVSTLAERLSLRGIHADWVTNGFDALEKVEEQHYDIAVLDVKIPKMTGIELKKKLEEKLPHMKFLFMTGHGSENDYKAGAAEAGEEYYLVKPIDIEVLIEKMKKTLQEKEKER
jgi:DNA-binding response OmpR family regulator